MLAIPGYIELTDGNEGGDHEVHLLEASQDRRRLHMLFIYTHAENCSQEEKTVSHTTRAPVGSAL